MENILNNLFTVSGTLSLEQIIANVAIALVLGLVIFASYAYTHAGTIYSTKFNVSLVMLAIVTSIVMTVIQNNIALSLGTIGALSIVRFRTAIKDPRDTVYIFWAISIGLCCGISCYNIAVVGVIVIFIFLLLFGRMKNADRLLLVIKASRKAERKIESTIFKLYDGKYTLRVKNTNSNNIELIYEISRKVYDKANQDNNVTDEIYKIKEVECFNVISQNDEISG